MKKFFALFFAWALVYGPFLPVMTAQWMVVLGGSPPAAASGTAAVTGHSLTSLRNDYTGRAGFEFTVGGSPITVTHVGRWVVAGNSGTHTVRITDSSGNTLTNGSASVNTSGATAAAYQYTALSTPVVLSASTTYAIFSDETNDGDQFYEFGITLTTTAAITAGQSAYSSGEGDIGLIGSSGTSYIPVNFKYQ